MWSDYQSPALGLVHVWGEVPVLGRPINGHFLTNTAFPGNQCYTTRRTLLTSEGVVGNADRFCCCSLVADWLGASGAYKQRIGHQVLI